MEKLTVNELFKKFYENNVNGGKEIYGVIVYSSHNWDDEYSLEARSYKVSSNNKRFFDGKTSNSYFGTSLDGSDVNVRLDKYYWDIDYCYLLNE